MVCRFRDTLRLTIPSTPRSSRRVHRPVCVELSRRQRYTAIGFRPLTAIIQEAMAQTSTCEEYAETAWEPARATHTCPNVRTRAPCRGRL